MAGKRKGKQTSNTVERKASVSKRSRITTDAISAEKTEEIPFNGSMETTTTASPSTSRGFTNFTGNTSSNIGSTDASDFISEPNCNGITPADLFELMKAAAIVPQFRLSFGDTDTIMLIDCRMQKDYSKCRIKFTNVVNVPPFVFDKNQDNNQEFISKTDVIKLFQEKCPDLLGYLFFPGNYTHIILMDETSPTNLPPSLKMLQLAMLKWNEATKTTIKFLQGGILAFSKQFPDSVITPELRNMLPGVPNPSPVPGTSQQQDTKDTMQSVSAKPDDSNNLLERNRKILNELEDLQTTVLGLQNKAISLLSIKNILLLERHEHSSKLLKYMEGQTPVEVKCPICRQTYSKEIIQCLNGHSVCEKCVVKINSCPDCGLSYYVAGIIGKVRNRVLENFMENSLRCECLCGESVMWKDVRYHAWICARGSEEIGKIEAEISLIEEERQKAETKLEEFNHGWDMEIKIRLAQKK